MSLRQKRTAERVGHLIGGVVTTSYNEVTMNKPSRIGVAKAKATLSKVLRSAEKHPVVIQSRGRDVGAIVSMEDYSLLKHASEKAGVAGWLERVAKLKKRHGGGADFEPRQMKLTPQRVQPSA
jgi:prevent-host-death family protein